MSTEAHHQPTDQDSPATLFPLPAVPASPPEPSGRARLQRPDRQQVLMHCLSLDALLPEDHQARVVWYYVDGLDLPELCAAIRAVEGKAGRPPIDPKLLMALWLYATLDGVGSAREVDRLCREHVAYRWLCGGVSVNYHTLADFRTAHVAVLDRLLTESVARLMHEDLVTMQRVAQDGVRVRASAGASSFRREKTLQRCRDEAQAQVETLRQELQGDPHAAARRRQARRQAAAEDRQTRVQRALEQLPEVAAKKKPSQKDKARVSTTDPDARVMKMADGGYRPAYNVQYATDSDTQIITGVDVTNNGDDHHQMPPMLEQHQQRYGRVPDETLTDGGFACCDSIEAASLTGTMVYAPVPSKKTDRLGPHDPHPEDSEAVAAWRARMATDQAQAIYRQRASTAECVNAIARNRGLRQFLVRGLAKVRAVALWYALAHNLVRAAALRRQAALAAG
jgi:transposase